MKVATKHSPAGDAGARQTAREMLRLIAWGSGQPQIRRLARRIAGGGTRAQKLARLFVWVRDNIAYQTDYEATLELCQQTGVCTSPRRTELIRSAEVTLAEGKGDCDCQSVLLGALIESLGLGPVAVVMAKEDPWREDFSHVLLAVMLDDMPAFLDPIDPDAPFGGVVDSVRELEYFWSAQPQHRTNASAHGVGLSFRDLDPRKWSKNLEGAVRNAAGELISKTGDLLDSAGNVIETYAQRVARGAATLVDEAGNPVELVQPIYDATKAYERQLRQTAEAAGQLVEYRNGEGAFGLPDIRLNPRAATAVAGGLIGAYTGVGIVPGLVMGGAVGSSSVNKYVWDGKRKLNEIAGEYLGVPIIPTSASEYMAQVAFIAYEVDLGIPGLNEALQIAVELYNAGRVAAAINAAQRAMDDNDVYFPDPPETTPGEDAQSSTGSERRKAAPEPDGARTRTKVIVALTLAAGGYLAWRLLR